MFYLQLYQMLIPDNTPLLPINEATSVEITILKTAHMYMCMHYGSTIIMLIQNNNIIDSDNIIKQKWRCTNHGVIYSPSKLNL